MTAAKYSMKASQRRAIRRVIHDLRCPCCRRIQLTPTSITRGVTALCGSCGWSGDPRQP